MKNLVILNLIFLPALLLAAGGTSLTVLDNGLTVYTQEDHAKPLISLFCIVDGGSRTETKDIAGLSHFYEHLIARGGSKKQKETEYRRRMMVLGQSHIYTYDDGTAYGFTVPTENFDEALWRTADFMMDLIPDTSGIRKERTIVMEEMHMSYTDNPFGRAYLNLHKAAFKVHPYYPETIGLAEVIETATLEKLKTFYEERYVPNQIVMAVVGDFQTDEMIAKIEREFGKYPPGDITFELDRTEPEQKAFRQIADSMEVSSSYVMLGYHIPPTRSPDMAPLMVLAQILGGSPNAGLRKALQVEENLASEVNVWPDFLRDTSLLYVYFRCDPSDEEKTIRKTFTLIRRLAVKGVSEEEVKAAQRKLIADDILKKETYRGRAENVCQYAIRRAPSLAENYPRLIREVTPRDVQDAARKYLNPHQASLSLIVPSGAPIRDYAPVADEYELKEARVTETNTSTEVFRRLLPNGITLIGAPDPSSPTLAVSIFVRGGQWLEKEGKAGSAALTTAMLDKGTEKYTREQIAAQQSSLQVSFETAAYEDYIHIGFSGLAQEARDAVHLLIQMTFHPTFPKDEFKKAKQEQIKAIKAVEDQPWELTHREALRDLYHRSPYRNPVLGREEEVRDITLGDLKDYYSRAFLPSNIIVAVSGRFDPDWVTKRFREASGLRFEEGPTPYPPEIPLVLDKPPAQSSRRLYYKKKDQNTFNISFLTVGVEHPDFLPLVLAKRILNTRLFFKYIYDKGMAYRMWTRMYPRMGQARFYFEMGCSDENFPVAVQGILKDLDDFLHESISEEDLATAKQDEITRNRMKFQTNREIAYELGYWEALGLGYDFFLDFPQRIESVTAGQVEEAARRYLGLDRYQLVNVGTAAVE